MHDVTGMTRARAVSRADITLTKEDLARKVYEICPTSRNEARAIVSCMFDLMFAAITRGETVKLHEFGKFAVRHKGARVGRNPRTSEPAPITERLVVTFKPAPRLQEAVNASTEAAARAETAE